MAKKLFWYCVVALYFSSECALCNVFDTLLNGVEPCKNACDKTYPLHTYPNPKHSECCKRGCRFYTLVELINERQSVNATRDACMASCMEAYSQTADRYACNIGCSSQIPTAALMQKQNQQQMPNDQPQTLHLLTPFMYVHNIYNNVLDHVSRMMSVSWSFYFQQDNGKVIVVQSEPEVLTEYLDMDDVEDRNKDDISSDGSDDLIVAAEGGAGPSVGDSADRKPQSGYDFRTGSGRDREPSYAPDIYFYHQQAVRKGSTGDELPVRITVSAYTSEEVQSVDWLGCVSRKSGLPRWLLGLIIFFSAMVMVWLCFATTATAPEHHIRPQILTVYGDMDYLKAAVQEKVRIQPCSEEDEPLLGQQAPPLPVKVNLATV